MTTVREQLADALPRVPLKAAWKKVIQVSRQRKKAGFTAPLSSRSVVDRLLNQPATGTASTLKSFLRDLHDSEDSVSEERALTLVEQWYESNAIRTAQDPVDIRVHLPNPLVAEGEIDRWLGTAHGRARVEPSEAALWVHRLHGLDVGGNRMRVEVSLPEGMALPAVQRKARGHAGTRGGQPWLPFTDDEGLFSLTPRPIANAHAASLTPGSTVVDPFCGLGGDSIAMALAGHSVFASDSSSVRLNLAKQNAERFNALGSIAFSVQGATDAITARLAAHPEACLYLDPPWGGRDWDRASMSFDALIGSVDGLERAMAGAKRTLVKLPRSFPTHTLPEDTHAWSVRLGLSVGEGGALESLKTLFAYGEIKV